MTPTSTAKAPRPPGPSSAAKRVAIYVRQSVDRGDEYGSTEAQREAIEAYVTSQRSLGWSALDTRYDDRGESGSTLDRPAFQRLLADIDAGRVNIVAVYKIDRLSRSLLDFTQLMRRFEERGVEFVSVTQQFSTSTSVGRMTLNLLATFAQFERETISERTRDKIAATRRRGLWTGGHPILGLDSVAGKLVVNESEAERVRAIFKLYLEHRSLMSTVAELSERGFTTKRWTNRAGRIVQGRAFDKATLRRLLTSPLVVGRMSLGDEVHAGAHAAIVEPEVFDAVQALLARGGRDRHIATTRNRWSVLLRGILRCGVCGSSMTSQATRRGPRVYRSYTCTKYVKEGAAACPGSRAPVAELERFVVERVRAVGRDPTLVATTLEAARRALATRQPDIDVEVARLAKDRHGIDGERQRLVQAVGRGGAGTTALVERLAVIDDETAAIDGQMQALRREVAALGGQVIDPDDLRAALTAFDPLWESLNTAERARVLRLLIEEVRFDARTSEVSITFRPSGIRDLGNQRSAT